jgi:hypothetical protein
MGFSSAIMQTGGMLSGAIGAAGAADSAKANYNFNAEMSAINARMAESDAQATLQAGQRAEQSQRLKTAQIKSSQRASMAANGIDLGSDSAVNVLTTTDYLGESDALTINANAIRSAGAQRAQSVNSSNAALVARANAAGINSSSAAMTSLLGSAGGVASAWYKYKKEG